MGEGLEEGEGGEVVGFVKWTPPGSTESFWTDYGDGQDERLCDAFFAAMGENREKLMGGRPHWCMLLLPPLSLNLLFSCWYIIKYYHRQPSTNRSFPPSSDVELMGVSAEYQRQGVGAMLLKPGCDMADRDGVEAYVDASPAAAPLYERFGFEVGNQCTMVEPFDWYVERFMVRPKKAAA